MPNPLLDAIKNDDYFTVSSILNQNPVTNSTILNQEYNYREGLVEQEVSAIPLHLAAFLLNPPLVKLILENGGDPNIRSMHLNYTPLDWVTSSNNILNPDVVSKKLEIIELLFYYGAKADDEIMENCISASVELGCVRDSQCVRATQEFQNNNQIVMALAYHTTLNYFLCLVRKGDCQEVLGFLDKIYFVKHPYVKFKLCEFKIDPNCNGGVYGSAILYAAELETPSMLNLLYEKGVELTAVDPMGNNVFHYAARSGGVENIKWLFQKLPSHIRLDLINSGNSHHINTPLHFAAKYSHVKSVDALLCFGAKKSNKNLQGKTAPELKITQEVEEIFEKYSDNSVPKLLWLAAKACANSSSKSKVAEVDELINLAETLSLEKKDTGVDFRRKRSNSV